VLHKQYYQILPLGLIVRTTSVDSRTIDAVFFGIGLLHLDVEALIAMTNKLLMHYGCKTATGQLMKTSYSLFFAELGLSFTPLQESCSHYSFLVTHSWMKMLWEKLSMFNNKVVIADIAHKYPWQGNQFIMQALVRAGYTGEMLRQLNREQNSLQLLFMSDILTALPSGNRIGTKILSRQPPGKTYSSMQWPNKQLAGSDMQLWQTTLLSIFPSWCKTSSISHFLGITHRIWQWSWCEDDSMLQRANNDGKM
jgi:hypothetical protein